MPTKQTRRRFLSMSLAGAAGLIGAPSARIAASSAGEGQLETTTIRIGRTLAACIAPQYLAEELLRAEGFTDIVRVDETVPEIAAAVAAGKVDFSMAYAPLLVTAMDAGLATTVVGGVMVGCFELFARDSIPNIGALKGKSVGVQAIGSLPQILVVLMAKQVGLDPDRDILWVTDPKLKPIELFIEGKIDAFVGFAPEPQELRARKIGHVLVNTALDRPWSQYFCCMLAGNPEFVRRHPVASKRVLRAMLKAADLCAGDPERAAQRLVEEGVTARFDYALQTMTELPYKWREYDPEDTMRFYALRLHEVGLIKSSPQKIIVRNSDWRFFNELKRELKA